MKPLTITMATNTEKKAVLEVFGQDFVDKLRDDHGQHLNKAQAEELIFSAIVAGMNQVIMEEKGKDALANADWTVKS